MKTSKPELKVPGVAILVASSMSYGHVDNAEDVAAIATPVVVAELRRLFSEIVTDWDAGDLSSVMDGFRMIRDRADKLEAGA